MSGHAHSLRSFTLILIAVCFTLPGIVLRFTGYENIPPPLAAVVFGVAIFASALLITWAAEAAQEDMSRGLVIALVALIAVLPEYGVDMAFTWKAGQNFAEYGEFPVANMTGANRLLIGIGWPLILLITWWKTRAHTLELEGARILELSVLLVATLYAFSIVVRGALAIYDFAILSILFVSYIYLTSRARGEKKPIVAGPAKAILALQGARRRTTIAVMFLFAAGAIFAVAEPFAEALIHSGSSLGIDEFMLVQWLAPFASEAPELILATLFVLHARPLDGLTALQSSNVNQWTLLVGTIPLVYIISRSFAQGSLTVEEFELSSRQATEIFLTGAQCLFALVLIARLRFSWAGATTLFALFVVQFIFSSPEMRIVFAWLYLALAGLLIVRDPGKISFFFGLCRKLLTPASSRH